VGIIRRSDHLARNFYVLDNSIAEDERLSWEARGLLVFLLVKPNDWSVSIQHLVNSGKAGKDKVGRMLKELETTGYISRKRVRGEDGRLSGVEYTVHEVPTSPAPKPEKPDMAKKKAGAASKTPQPENPAMDESPKPEKPEPVKPAPVNPRLLNTQDKQEPNIPNQQHSIAPESPESLVDRGGIEMNDDWEPKPETLLRLQMHQGVPVEFARSQIPEFRMYWLTRGEKPRSSNWDTAFCQRIRSEWEHSKLEQAKQAQEPTWNPLDFDWTSWHLLPGGGQIDFGHIRHWMTCRMTARKVVTQDLINSLADQLATANLATGVPVEALVAEVANRNWVTIKAEWLVKSFEEIAGVSSTEALQARLKDTSW